MSYYPKTLEWQYRDEYPFDDALNLQTQFSPNDWETVNENDTSMIETKIKTPEEFQKEIEELKLKYNLKKPDMWEGSSENSKVHSNHDVNMHNKH